ncbi:MAG: hybrid sensor histidine kinase/response regulator [Deltaproteobacteria bacterium]|nr:hybrid sensor histidine kinase/response regulator [Deltaproteobacteria bacterium]
MAVTEMVNEKATILFVDDETRVLKSIKRGLIGEPYDCLFALSGMEALEIMASRPVQVIITDMRMPEMNGLELLREVRKRYPETIRMVLSGYAQTNTVLAAVNEGYVYRYITKPWRLDEDLKAGIEDALEVYRLNREQRLAVDELEKANRQLLGKIEQETKTVEKTRKIAEHIYRQKTLTLKLAFEKTKVIVNSIDSDATNLGMAGGLSQDARELTEHIREICQGFMGEVSRVTRLAEMEAGSRVPVPGTSLNLKEFFHKLQDEALAKNQNQDLDIQCSVDETLPAVIVFDPDFFWEICWNILENTLFYVPQGNVFCCCRSAGENMLEIECRDQGPGIPVAERRTVLEPFVQASNSCCPERLGLGLALARTAAKKLKGKMAIGDQDGQGCRVIVRLPLDLPTDSQA